MKRKTLVSVLSAALALGALSSTAMGADEVLARVAGSAATTTNGTPAALTVFLADPELGIVGSYSNGSETIYFEARRAEPAGGGSGLSVRLLDAGGRTFALSGASMNQQWLASERYDASAAAASQTLALALAGELAATLADPVFQSERTALQDLALDAASANLGTDKLIRPLPHAAKAAASEGARSAYYQRAGAELVWSRAKSGDLKAAFRDTRLDALTLDFPTERNEEGNGPRLETYARLASADGTTLSAEYGGDFAPSGWIPASDALATAAPVPMDAHLQNLGEAVMAAHLLARSAPKSAGLLPAVQIESFQRLATGLREELLPRTDETRALLERDNPTDLAKAGGTWSSTNNKSSNSNIWRKDLNNSPLGEHSGNRVGHYTWPTRTTYYLDHDHRFCNHGGCPYSSTMNQKCQFSGNFHSYWPSVPQRNTTPNKPDDHTWHTCSTNYSLVSGLGPGGGHNCHDDTWTQLHYTNFQAVGVASNRCDDGAFYASAPSCGDSGSPR